MQADFWHDKWKKKELGFHEAEGNQYLKKNIAILKLAKENRVFIPLCGKTHDIKWLLSQGYKVVGAELSELAIKELFSDLELTPSVLDIDGFRRYHAESIDVFVGDIFNLSAELLGPVDAIYDRAALVALPIEMRCSYTKLLCKLTNNAPQLLIVFEYDQSVMAGPPFAILPDEVREHYQEHYHLRQISNELMTEKLKGNRAAREVVWHLTQ
ncbi:thiopurine S-methyltransferase [Terasakiella sp. A23]|uniref:thiopurine S-methyltransferase n=1 Tax=Terasakiella sp. FCG-A23 TaxID=3080561 RepID=UPI00295413A1|nr:thiopurine S-methyltransferase [Terasakiella sp. A23]MDV7338878.1 thiopurine S-methyltransferase [Terasakiella sp. A23]